MQVSSPFLTQRFGLDLCEFTLGFQRQAEGATEQDSKGNDLGVVSLGLHLWATCTEKPRVARALDCHAGALGRVSSPRPRVCLLEGRLPCGVSPGFLPFLPGPLVGLRCLTGTLSGGRASSVFIWTWPGLVVN